MSVEPRLLTFPQALHWAEEAFQACHYPIPGRLSVSIALGHPPRATSRPEGLLLQVGPDWVERVALEGLQAVDRLFTLSMEDLIDTRGLPDAWEAWKATWLRMGDEGLVSTEGVLVRSAGGQVAHGVNLRLAIGALVRRAGMDTSLIPGDPAEEARLCAELLKDERLQGLGHALSLLGLVELRTLMRALPAWDRTMTLADSLESGNCEDGTIDWAHRHLGGQLQGTIGQIVTQALLTQDRVGMVLTGVRAALRPQRVAAIA